jgi:Mg2+ and Co2+ transporter CorA
MFIPAVAMADYSHSKAEYKRTQDAMELISTAFCIHYLFNEDKQVQTNVIKCFFTENGFYFITLTKCKIMNLLIFWTLPMTITVNANTKKEIDLSAEFCNGALHNFGVG